MSDLSYTESIFIGLLQGVSELFPVSSLGHSVLVPALIGGKWAADADMGAKGSPYLDTLVAMHVATAAALIIFFWRDWVRIIGGLITSIRRRKIDTADARLAWLLIAGTIPVGIAGILLDKVMREYLGKPIPTAVFLIINGGVLFAVERLQRRRQPVAVKADYEDIPWPASDPEFGPAAAGPHEETMVIPRIGDHTELDPGAAAVAADVAVDRRLSRLSVKEAIAIGACQMFALLPGISRSGITMVGGLMRGLRHEQAARFAFLLATPAILGAGLLKMPELLKPEMSGSLGPALAGSLVAGIAAYFSLRFLTGYFETRTLNPFAIYCIVAGLGCLAFFGLRAA